MRRLKIAIVDGFCPRPYEGQTWEHEAMGGTELTAARVAEALAADHDLVVLQHCRQQVACSAAGVCYEPGGDWRKLAGTRNSDVVIIINSLKLLALWRKHAPAQTRLILWRHNFMGATHKYAAKLLADTNAQMICVSHSHRHHTLATLGIAEGSASSARIGVIYNPVVTDQRGQRLTVQTGVDSNQLLFASSPHKGLEQVLDNFMKLRQRIPQLSLLVCNPGYLERPLPIYDGVRYTGKLRPAQVHAQMRRSLCLFNAQSTFAETFGLVFAESHSMGTPVVAQRGLGAVDEVVGDEHGQVLNVNDVQAVYELIARWRDGQRPQLSKNPAFDLDAVKTQWLKLLCSIVVDSETQQSNIGIVPKAMA
ncbi:MAG: glycosyltransferase family 4 protein [Advenella sp.]|uniref:glycosyltransferase family 4 protein n=1 Tax=Advenella sp. TaxID=1872388 RepID=UPI003F99E778